MKNRRSVQWVRRRSEQSGYTGAVYITDKGGEYIRIDYNVSKKSARLTVEDRSEKRFTSEIISNKVIAEKSSSTPDIVRKVMRRKASCFSAVPDSRVLSIIVGCYGIARNKGTAPISKRSGISLPTLHAGIFISIAVLIVVAVAISFAWRTF